tara:strand:+ start:413 stop:688 length:276 start_codon:yes stop_codon:yes gene_type:complete
VKQNSGAEWQANRQIIRHWLQILMPLENEEKQKPVSTQQNTKKCLENEAMPKNKYSAKQKRLAAIAPPRDSITAADLKAARKKKKKKRSKT